ncbi:unnamed protein product, partial [marine sediment metagenome]
AKIGIFGQPASAVPLASVKKLREQSFLDENDTVVCIVTGGGLKDTTVFENLELKIVNSRLENLNELIGSERQRIDAAASNRRGFLEN